MDENIIHSGNLYGPFEVDFELEQKAHKDKLNEYNRQRLSGKESDLSLADCFKSVGENVYIEPPVYANWGGKHVSLGDNVYINFNCVFVDDTYIDIGSHTLVGPNVTFVTGNHPLNAMQRKEALQYNQPIKVGKNVWIGANAVILPGVTIGDNSIIGAGSIVTKDIPSNVVAVGVPCKPIKKVPATPEEEGEMR